MRTIISNIKRIHLFLYFFVFCFFAATVAAQEFPRPAGDWGGGRMPRGGFGGERFGGNRPPDGAFPRQPFPGGEWRGTGGGVPGGFRGGAGNAENSRIEIDMQLGNNERNEISLQRLRDFDTNKNGIIEQNEMSDPQRRESINRIVTRLGGNPNQTTVNINELAKQVASSNRGVALLPNLPVNPLVPYFGENETQHETVLQFGEREKTPASTAKTNKSDSQTNPNNDKLAQARTIMTQFDSNRNGTLDKDKDEWKGLSMDGNNTDQNKDGRISLDELVLALGGSSSSSIPAFVRTKPSIPYEHLPAGMPDWFFERDHDKDAQLTMLEYANGVELNDAIATEFVFLDKNNDGVATVAEIFQTLKQVDEEKQRKADLARREKELKLGNINNKVLSTKITNVNNATPTNPNPITQPQVSTTNIDDSKAPMLPPPPPTPAIPLPPPPSPPVGNGESLTSFPQVKPTEQPADSTVTSPTNTWKPGSPIVAPTETPSTAPYVTGTSNNNNYRTGNTRDNGRNNREGWNRENWGGRGRGNNNQPNERRNEQRRGRN
ncbi:MAG: hypothetical protein LBC74_03935 [Planctomycetaceae bacterium]|jgi:Ca2+-binding EF-hand superfamily protein|nr:hypothetical protein [Planctomycetaceae bacterium]